MTTKKAGPKKTKKGSTEIETMQGIEKAFEGLDADVQARVLRWAADRYGVTLAGKRAAAPPTGDVLSGDTEQFATLADFFTAAAPVSEPDCALVVAYWFQFVKGDADFDAQRVNTELKQLGRGVGNITQAFGSLIERRPQLVIQTKKTGTARQARKKYRVTILGKTAVESMLRPSDAQA